MKRKGLQRVLAMALSATMVLTGITFPAEAVKAETIGSVIWSDDMETLSAADAGWTVTWSGTEGTGTEGRTANEWAANNTTTWWNFKTETEAQTLTLTKVVEDLPAGSYQASIDADGGNATGTIAVKAGEASQTADITLGAWDVFATTTTDVLTTTETADITIEITMDSLVEGWFDFDNIQLFGEKAPVYIENTIWSDDMETVSAADAGWTVAWSGTEGTGTEGRTANEWAANNTTTWWNFKTETEAQTLTLTKVVEDLPAGAYKASIDADGGNATGTIAVKAGEASQVADITLGAWDNFVTTTTGVLTTTEAADVTIEITMDSLVEGWFDFDNIKLVSLVEDKYGTLVNGDLSANTTGWTITGDVPEVTDSTLANGCMISSDDAGNYLSIWTEEGFAGTYSMSQTIENVAAGDYTAKVAAVGNGGKGASESKNSLTLTVKNDTQNTEVSVQIIPDGWDNWNAISKTEALSVADGDTVTVTISGALDGKEWYGLKNVVFDTDTTIEAPISVEKVPGLSEDFIHGIDVSTYLSIIQSGAKYYDENGVEKNMFEIFSDAGVNYVRLRVWNCPFSVDDNGNYLYVDAEGTEYTADKVTTTQHELGYYVYKLEDGTEVFRKGYGAGNADIDMAVATGKIATQYGMKVLIDFHYSDFWADPAKYRVPKAWEGMDIDTKAKALADYTTECLQKLKDAGVDVGMVQVGNEINNGLSGENNWDNVAKLLKAGTEAVRNFDKDILIAIHYANPESGEHANRAARLEAAGIDYDVFASSYYSFWHGTLSNLTAVLKDIADTYNKKVMVAEVSYCATLEDGDGGGSVVNKTTSPLNYSIDAEGQAAAVRDAIAAVAAVGEAGIGTFYWEPAWIPVKNYADAAEEDKAEILAYNSTMWQRYGSGWASLWSGDAGDDYDPGVSADPYTHGSEWDNQAMFDFNGVALPSINVYKWVYTGAEGPVRVSTVDTLTYKMEYKTTPELPNTVNAYLNDGNTVENIAVTWDAEQLAALATADFGDYTIDGTLNEFSYESKGETITVEAGTIATSCSVKVYGTNYLVNGDFEDNDGDGSGWTLTGSANLANKASDAKSGNYHWSAWAESALDFTVGQRVETEVLDGKYTLFAYYQGTSVETVEEGSGLYIKINYADGTEELKVGTIEIPNTWQVFHQAKVNDIIINKNVTNIEVWSRLSVTGAGPWVVLDDVNLCRVGDLTAEEAAFGKYVTPYDKCLEATATASSDYTAGWETVDGPKNDWEPTVSASVAGLGWGNWAPQEAGSEHFYQYTWENAITTNKFEIFWYDDGAGTRVPGTLKVMYLDEAGEWKEATMLSAYEDIIAIDQYNVINIEPVTTTAIKLVMTVNEAENCAANGILRWKVLPEEKEPVCEHIWNDGEVTKEATTTEKGEKTYTCTVCGETKTEEIPMLEKEPTPAPTPVEYTVTFMDQTTVLSTVKVAEGAAATAPAAVKKGYVFKGWDKTFDKITADTTVTAQWEKVAKPAKVKSVKAKNSSKKAMKVTFKKVKNVDGYEIRYATKANMKKAVKVDTTKTNATIKRLKKGKTYYVQVLAFNLDSTGEKIYSKVSNKAKVKIRK